MNKFSFDFINLNPIKMETATNFIYRIFRPIVSPITGFRRSKMINQEIEKRVSFNKVELKNEILLDLGANRGDFSKWGLRNQMNVFAFEPNISAFTVLQKRLGKYDNFNGFNCAIGNKVRIQKLFLHKNDSQDPIGFSISSSLMEKKSNISNEKFQNTVQIDFKSILESLSRIKILKIDIEGAEILIWPEIINNHTKIDYLFLEIHDQVNPELRKDFARFVNQNNLQEQWFGNWV